MKENFKKWNVIFNEQNLQGFRGKRNNQIHAQSQQCKHIEKIRIAPGDFIVNFKHILHQFLVSVSSTLNS